MPTIDPSIRHIIDRSAELSDHGRDEENAAFLRASLLDHPGHPQLHFMASTAARTLGDLEEAKEHTRRGAALVHDDAEGLTWAATQILDLGEPDEARRWTRRVTEIADPEEFALSAEFFHLAGRLAVLRDDLEAGEKMLRLSFDLEPGGVGVATELGRLLLLMGQLDEAASVVDEGLSHQPDDSRLLELRDLLSSS